MNLRVALRNWLLKPTRAERRDDPGAVELVGCLTYGHIQRDMERELAGGSFPQREFPPAVPGEGRQFISYVGNPLLDDEGVTR